MNKPAVNSRELYFRLFSYTSNYKGFFFISFVGFLIFGASQGALIKCIELFLNELEGKPTEWVKHMPAFLVQSIFLLPAVVLVLSLFRGIGAYFGSYFISRVGLHVVNDLRKQVFDKLLTLPQSYYDKNNSSKQISLVIYNIEQVSSSVTKAVKTLFEEGLFLVVLLYMLFSENWQLTLVFFAAAPVLAGLVFIAARYFRKTSRRIQASVGKVTHVTNEAIQGIQVVKSYNAEKFEAGRFHDAADENLRYKNKYARVSALQTPIMHFVIAIALATLFYLVLLFWPAGEAGSAVAYLTAAGALGRPIKALSGIISLIQTGLAAAETIFAVIDEESEKNDGNIKLDRANGNIAFQQLNFGYDSSQAVIKNLNLDINAGQTVALVGHSGSGKSTIASLLMRLYRCADGAILIDGQDINDIKLSELRRNISFVSQSPVIFEASVEDNVVYGSSEHGQEKLLDALKNANAWDFVQELEDGVKTDVGEGGGKLSGGQRQRLAIARALYKDAPILILDEATSALDNQSEKLIQQALERLKQGRTTLVIAHRLSTVRDADVIVVLDHGHIVEQGSHEQLLEQNGHYAQLYHSQDDSSEKASQ
ncbi:lipid A export permease/ATP-binding protein MsbA [Agaribacterium haliotis]|uniref:lipid A export permease/ATP-binding protein MsbA n=1 Tax=Agaribacterium haliotis TaxID=2013869 RepID=UPI000BB55D07|nr:lipid A export permease/ATP-binding protein MsbA [Agaribacterium haliotis]